MTRLTLGQISSIKIKLDIIRSSIEFHHHVLHLTGHSVTDARGGHGLEPVAVRVGTAVYGPVV